MIHQPPSGARDLLPLDVAQKRWIEERLRPVFEQWGYHRIIPSTVERLDTLMAGGAIDASTAIQLQETEEDMPLALRPEVTASIARSAVTRMAGSSYPQRLYYNANVFRRHREGYHGSQQEFYQAGVELLGAGGLLADAEIVLLLRQCLQSLGLQKSRVILGEAGLTRSLLRSFPPALQDKVRHAIAHLNRLTIEALPLSPAQRDRALFLFDLRGRPADVLQRVATLDLDESERATLENLKSLVDLLADYFPSPSQETSPSTAEVQPLILDLSLIQPWDYYTGIVFEVVCETDSGQLVLGQGGRYDRLLSLYHPQEEDIPGIGFALNIEDLHQVLLPTGQLPRATPPTDTLVVPRTPQAFSAAFSYAQTLRESHDSGRVEVDLQPRPTTEAVRDYARSRAIARIAWVDGHGLTETESVL
ncbi:ATP phosphoribosyltransferase regulatory subunit [Phormidium sp. CCY1219]|uniref:ATP phosphoribosyltransferase regulatory subunit n=1 Tax=Phormidium sp. CCY1219 TaxID=2886104 RepID=UPI002D1EC49E|nr:ATP phosphoribosyltransferase regulatory subunit [Phormidium sp. CCY1219]MEB3831748.1 ATP phosphoribosyltransferase regulatory subunit [Phormidium sp. CCY1219]